MPTWREMLQEEIDYDRYANTRWLPYITSSANGEELSVFKHILAASTIWVSRMEGVSLSSIPDVEVSNDALGDLHRRWSAVIGQTDFDQVIDYRNRLGESYSRTFGDIIRHAMNHGTYHRGQLRSMFGARGADFPETDFIEFAFVRDGFTL